MEKVNAETKLDCNLFETLLKTLESQFLENKEHINNKLEHVSNVYELRSTEFTWNEIKQCIEKANKKISEHNRIVKEFASETQKLKKDIWFFVAEESQSAHKAHGKKVDGLKKGINAIKKYITEKEIEAKSLDSEIKALNKNVTSVQPTVDENKIRNLIASNFYLDATNVVFIGNPGVGNYGKILFMERNMSKC